MLRLLERSPDIHEADITSVQQATWDQMQGSPTSRPTSQKSVAVPVVLGRRLWTRPTHLALVNAPPAEVTRSGDHASIVQALGTSHSDSSR